MQVNNFVSCETYQQLESFSRLLIKWNGAINLIADSTVNNVMNRHILDSVQLIEYIDFNQSVVDLGSGGGFPGIILSICGVKNVTLVESDHRKCAFLFQAARISPNPVRILNSRIEEAELTEYDIVTSRALTSLPKLFTYLQKISFRDKCLIHKGSSYAKELEEAEKDWLFEVIMHDSICLEKAKILEVKNIRPIL